MLVSKATWAVKVALKQDIDWNAYRFARRRMQTDAIIINEITQRMIERLTLFKINPARVALMGSGLELMLAVVAKNYPKADCLGFDTTINQQVKRRRWKSAKLLGVSHYDCLPLKDRSVDLLLANLNLLAVNNIEKYFQELLRVLKPEACVLLTAFGPDTLKELRHSFSFDKYPHVQEFIDMHDLGDALLQTGFIDPVVDMEQLTFQYNKVKHLCQDLKAAGLTNIHPQRQRGLLPKNTWQKMCENYQAQYNEILPASFEIIYIHAWAPKQLMAKAVNGEVVIPVSHIKK
ncbi:MAG: methyltransferase domain-containing protein [Gammaproteobacteria bacterium]|nr:methyltransferase domain-containing protein [Gammaproteobacteria bacterium]